MNIDRIVKELISGNIVITPTDTVYGIMADALNSNAVDKVFHEKKRENKPLLILVSDKKIAISSLTSLILVAYTNHG